MKKIKTNLKNMEKIVIYQDGQGNIELRADIENDTIWATRTQVARLFETTPQNITIHLGNIYKDGELEEISTSKKSLLVQTEGTRITRRLVDLYNLDAIIAVGYRINSKKATQFRIWATKVLHEYIINGYSLNKYKLQNSKESLEGLYEAIALIESKDLQGTLKEKITIKLTKNLVQKK